MTAAGALRYALPVVIVLVTLTVVAGSASAQQSETVYKCIHPDGRIVYSDRPCIGLEHGQGHGEMEEQTIIAPAPGTGGEAAREGTERLAREYDARREAEEKARREARQRASAQPPVYPEDAARPTGQNQARGYPYLYPHGYPAAPYDQYRRRSYGGGLRLGNHGLSLWFGHRRPLPRHHHHHRPPFPGHGRPSRDPYSADGRPIREPGYSGRYPGGFPGYR